MINIFTLDFKGIMYKFILRIFKHVNTILFYFSNSLKFQSFWKCYHCEMIENSKRFQIWFLYKYNNFQMFNQN